MSDTQIYKKCAFCGEVWALDHECEWTCPEPPAAPAGETPHKHDFQPPSNDDEQQCDTDCRMNWHKCHICGKTRTQLGYRDGYTDVRVVPSAPPAPAPHLHTPDDGPCDLCGDGKPVLRCSCPPSDTNPGCPVHCGAYRAGYLDAQKGAATAREWLRENGWVVAVHNDYKLDGELHTFWLFTKGDNCAKGEGRTDDEALAQCQLAASRTAALSAQVAELERQLKEKK